MAFATLKTLGTMLKGRRSSEDHQQSLNDFYGPQADNYDSFRERLLHGRAELIAALDIQPGERVIELGGGTGRNLEFFAERVETCDRIDLVDLCEPLLNVAAIGCVPRVGSTLSTPTLRMPANGSRKPWPTWCIVRTRRV